MSFSCINVLHFGVNFFFLPLLSLLHLCLLILLKQASFFYWTFTFLQEFVLIVIININEILLSEHTSVTSPTNPVRLFIFWVRNMLVDTSLGYSWFTCIISLQRNMTNTLVNGEKYMNLAYRSPGHMLATEFTFSAFLQHLS